MKAASSFSKIQTETAGEKGFTVDTTFVLFFLAIEFGRTFSKLNLDNIFLFATLLMVVVIPYFLVSGEKPKFSGWVFGRSLIASFAMLLGMMFQKSIGVVLPETFKFLPMTLLIIAAMLSCYIQFYGFLKLRLAK
ncbi:MAG TPA: hypothetical protein VNI60_10950 [Pyrinomonadaceae bacterium]|nr:hypothetical protein [Pyrinomonadaceae bacterium]